MHNFSLRLGLGILLSTCLLRCQPPVLDPVPEGDTLPLWQSHPEVRLDRRLQMHAHVADDRLWLLGNNYLLSLDTAHRLVSDVLVAPHGNEIWYRSFLSKNIFATELHRQHQFDLRLNHHPATRVRVDLRALDSTVLELNNYYGPPMAINDQGQILVGGWVNAAQHPGITGFPLFLLQTQQTGDSLAITHTERIRVDNGIYNYVNANRLNGMYAFGNTFYFSLTSGSSKKEVYRLVPGQAPEILLPITLAYMFWVHDTLTTIGYGEDNSLGWYFRPPGSEVWEGRNLGYFDNGFARFEAVSDRVIAYRGTQLWELSPNRDRTQVQVQELNNQGLEQVVIHDLAVFQDRVYLCTSRGLYYQSISDFFTHKPTP